MTASDPAPPAGETASTTCRSAKVLIASETGWRGSSSTIGTPRLIAAGTSRELGICVAIGARSVFSTSLVARPTFESARLSTIRQRSRG